MGFNLPVLNRRRRLLGTATPIFSPATLFTLSEPGIWLDPSDVANLAWRRNLLTWTEQFDNAAWTKLAGWAVAANSTVAPDGTATADAIVPAAGTSTPYTLRTVTVSATSHSATIYVKAGNAGVQWVRFVDANHTNGQAWFDIVNGVVGTKQAGISTTSITAAANGFWRIEIVLTKSNTSFEFALAYAFANGDGATTKTWNGTEIAFYLWGAQLELGSTATEYQRITDVNTEVIERFPNNTLYQDTAGTTPVTTPGQTVALALDKSKGLVLGSELVTNGAFDTDTAGWTLAAGGSATVSGGVVTLTNVSSRARLSQFITTVSGRSYRVTVSGVNLGNSPVSSARVLLGASQVILAAGTNSVVYVATGASTEVALFENDTTAGFFFSLDNISVKELPGFHATQATTASRPIYGINPVGGRRNLFERTEEFDNAYWTKNGATITANTSVAPDGTTTADKMVESATNAAHRIQRNFTSTTGVTYAFSCYAKAAERSWVFLYDDMSNSYAYFDVANGVKGTIGAGWSSSNIQSVGNGWYRISGVATEASGAAGAQLIGVTTGNNVNSYAGDGTSGILIWGAQLETGSTATAYQKVTTQYDVTEAGVASVSYLAFDGVDDFLVTPTITPGIDKAQVFAGVRKLSDAAAGMVVELSANTNSNAGVLNATAPSGATASYGFSSKGTTVATANYNNAAVIAPITNVLTGIGDISGDLATLRINGTQVSQSTADQGTGNFLAYPLYIGRRGGTTVPFNGNLYSLIVRFGTNLTTDTITSTETWVNGKTGAYA